MSIAGQSLLATLGRVICMYSFLRGAHLHVLSVSIFFLLLLLSFFPEPPEPAVPEAFSWNGRQGARRAQGGGGEAGRVGEREKAEGAG